MATFYQSNADTIIKADMNQESNNLKALQTMQQITQAVMGINNQNEQGVTRLLY
jgi:flagellin-like hook-associated protein FlgL